MRYGYLLQFTERGRKIWKDIDNKEKKATNSAESAQLAQLTNNTTSVMASCLSED